jgi:hypothetical protein
MDLALSFAAARPKDLNNLAPLGALSLALITGGRTL